MIKQEEKRRVLKPFILAYQGEGAAHSGKKGIAKGSHERIQDTRKVINRVIERVKRI